MGLFSNFRRAAAATAAFNAPLHEVLGDINKVHPELRRFAIALLMESGVVDRPDRLAGFGRILANAVVSLHTGRDCNEIEQAHWTQLGEIYRAVGGAMEELGERPKLTWPSYDREAAPAWATLKE